MIYQARLRCNIELSDNLIEVNMHQLKALKYSDIQEPVEVLPLGRKAAIFKIEVVERRHDRGEVRTPDGVMVRVKMRNVADFQNPETDVAVLVGRAKRITDTGKPHPQPPEVWFWRDEFWIRAHDGMSEYYRNKQYLLYSVTVLDKDRVMEQVMLD